MLREKKHGCYNIGEWLLFTGCRRILSCYGHWLCRYYRLRIAVMAYRIARMPVAKTTEPVTLAGQWRLKLPVAIREALRFGLARRMRANIVTNI